MKTIFCTLLLSIISLKASQSWGFSDLRTKKYLEQAVELKLWQDPQWIKLGHYEKGFFNYTSPFRQGFFLSPDGAISPEKELIKTIEILFSDVEDKTMTDQNKHPQCRYLARKQWIKSILKISNEDILPCDEITKWKKELNIKSVALIFAAADLGNASSSYGHTFLKFINPANAKNKDLIDYGINYAANADANEGFFYALKGLLGFYAGQFTMMPYHQKIIEYINLEGRDIWEYHLNLTEIEVNFLVDHLIELEGARAPYYFFSDNCSYQILRVIETVRPKLNLADSFKYFVIPIDSVKKMTALSKNPNTKIVDFIKYIKSLKIDYLQSYSQLSFKQRSSLNDAVGTYTIPDSFKFNNIEKAEVFETAMKYYSLKAFKSKNNYENEKYKLYLERVSLGQQAVAENKNPAQPPEQSHDSSAVYFGLGQKNKYNFSSLKFRHAFHDLEQPDFGTVPFSHNEAASFEARYNHSNLNLNLNSNSNLYLYKFTLLKLINLDPVTQFDSNFSWRVNFAVYNQWKPFLQLGAGYSFDLNLFQRTRIALMAQAHSYSEVDSNTELKYLNGVSPNILIATRLSDQIGLSLDINQEFNLYNDTFFRFQTKFDYSFMHNFDVQLSAENHFDHTTEYHSQFVWNFIF